MHIILQNTGKRYNREWIFRHFNFQFISGGRYAITGPNGSGKSTLLQILAGTMQPSSGNIQYSSISSEGPFIDNSAVYNFTSFAAPYLELIEEMTAIEQLHFHCGFKKMKVENEFILAASGLLKARDKQIRYFSSGMKQRLKLALAFFSDTPLILLDEPLTNLDAEGADLYKDWINSYGSGRTVIISSNDKQEYGFCEHIIDITAFKL